MTELYGIYQRSTGDGNDFLDRVIPLMTEDVEVGDWRKRVEVARYWEREHGEMLKAVTQLGATDFQLHRAMRDWANHLGDILAHVNDVLAPRGMGDIVKDNCRGFREMLRRKRAAIGPN